MLPDGGGYKGDLTRNSPNPIIADHHKRAIKIIHETSVANRSTKRQA